MSHTPSSDPGPIEHCLVPSVEEMFHLYGNDILRVCNVYLGKRSLAEDAFQDVFVKAITRSKSFRGESDVKYWLIAIARNVCKDYLKSVWQSRVGSYEEWTETSGGTSDVTHQRSKTQTGAQEDRIIGDMIEDSDLMKAVKSLPAKYKDVILLRFYFDLDTHEIARQLGIAENSVRSRLFRARKKMAPFMDTEEI
ncbi:MAG: sigma-70 family RNA polymerase sigma factor [Clostridiales bacterium]|nr:sigma-70 family RNA polymerase sigma factor [Clostridiales bacterium]